MFFYTILSIDNPIQSEALQLVRAYYMALNLQAGFGWELEQIAGHAWSYPQLNGRRRTPFLKLQSSAPCRVSNPRVEWQSFNSTNELHPPPTRLSLCLLASLLGSLTASLSD